VFGGARRIMAAEMKSLLIAALLAVVPACGQLWTVHVRDGVQMAAIMSCGDYGWGDGGRATKQPDCLMVHVKPATAVQRVLITLHVVPGEDGMPWVWRWVDARSRWTVAAFEPFAGRKVLAIDIEGFDGDQSVWWVSFPMR
jgi:hypothetical protein